MKGFFKNSQLLSRRSIQVGKTPYCGACGLHKYCKSPKMPPTGKGTKKILFIAEIPGKNEDERNIQLIGKTGQKLRQILKFLKPSIDLDIHARKINAVNCRAIDKNGNNRTPTDDEINYCRPNVIKEIKNFQPHLIILLGGSAVKSYWGHRWKGGKLGGVTKWRGWTIPDYEHNCWVCPTYHPSFVVRDKDKVAEIMWEEDLQRALNKLNKPLPKQFDNSMIKICKNKKEINHELEFLLTVKPITSFDYETTGLKPEMKGHKIATISVSYEKHQAFTFPFIEEIHPLWKRFLIDKEIKKIAANIKFEHKWSRRLLGVQTQGWLWDTMISSHILDNRRGVTGLKFQALVNFGVEDYSSHISPFLKGDEKHGANSINQIDEIDIDELLLYNGWDSMIEFHLALKQMKMAGITI